jgi:hypothetical protein
VHEKTKEALQEVIQNKKSPIYFFMHREMMDISLLAEYMGFWKWKVKRHLKPSIFSKLDKEQLAKYAEIFRLEDVNDLANFDAKKWM